MSAAPNLESMTHRRARIAASALAVALGIPLGASLLRAQDPLERSPDLSGGWVSRPGMVHFNFLHRFSASPAPERKVTSAPTFLLAAALPAHVLLGFLYATNSELAPGYPNEWEFFGRYAPLRQAGRMPVGLAVQAGYNLAADGLDGELSAARTEGPVRALGAIRVLSPLPDENGARVALAGGVVVRVARYVALAGDVGTLTRRRPGEDVAWGVGLQLAIPHTPHGLSLQVGNSNNATLQGASRGTGQTRYGFEFTIPVTLARYFGRRRTPPPAATVPVRADTVQVAIEGYGFHPAQVVVAPGTPVTFTNHDQVAHTVTGEDGTESGEIAPGTSHTLIFTGTGSHPFHCTPHPFMTGVVEVRAP